MKRMGNAVLQERNQEEERQNKKPTQRDGVLQESNEEEERKNKKPTQLDGVL